MSTGLPAREVVRHVTRGKATVWGLTSLEEAAGLHHRFEAYDLFHVHRRRQQLGELGRLTVGREMSGTTELALNRGRVDHRTVVKRR
jgi:hypothetical protein